MMVKHVCDLKIFHLIDAYLVDLLVVSKNSLYFCRKINIIMNTKMKKFFELAKDNSTYEQLMFTVREYEKTHTAVFPQSFHP